MMNKPEQPKTSELAALAELLEYARLTAVELKQPFLAHLLQMAVDEGREATTRGGSRRPLSDLQAVNGVS